MGKTTLALAPGEQRNAIYLDLEDSDDCNRLSNSGLFFEAIEDRLVIFYVTHCMPEDFDTLRGVIDKGRRKNKDKGDYYSSVRP